MILLRAAVAHHHHRHRGQPTGRASARHRRSSGWLFTVGGNALSGSTLGDGTAGEHAFAWTGAQLASSARSRLSKWHLQLHTEPPQSSSPALVEGATLTGTFTYTYTDKDGDPATGSVTITITGTEDKPTTGESSSTTSPKTAAPTHGWHPFRSTLGDAAGERARFPGLRAQTGQFGTVTLIQMAPSASH